MRREAQLKRLAEETQGSLKTTAPVDYLPNAGVVESKSPEVTTTLAQGVAPRADKYGMSRIRRHVAYGSEMKSLYSLAPSPPPLLRAFYYGNRLLSIGLKWRDRTPIAASVNPVRKTVSDGAIRPKYPSQGSRATVQRTGWTRGAMGFDHERTE
jgi:hypothetical protein